MEWLDLLSVQGTLKSLLQHQHSSKASILQGSALSVVQLSHPHMTTGKTIALTRQTFAGKVMSLLFTIDFSPSGSPVPGIDSPGKNTGVGCYFLLQCMKVKSESEVPQSCLTQRPHGLQFIYDKPRQHIKKQRHYFADKDPSSQSYDFSINHEWM